MLLRYQLKSVLYMFRTEPAVAIVAAGFFVVGLLVMLGEYFGFLCGFRYLAGEASPCRTPVVESQAYFADAITFYALEVFFAAIFLIGAIASAISALAVFWHARDLALLKTAPWSSGKVTRELLPIFFLLILWPPLVLALPGIIALGVARHAPVLFYFGGFAAIILFILLLAGVGLMLAAVLVRILERLTRLRAALTIPLVFAGIFFGLRAFLLPQDLIATFQAVNLEQAASPIAPIEQYFRLWPTHPIAETVFKLAQGSSADAFLWLAGATVISIALLGAGFTLTQKFWPLISQRLQEGTFLARAARATRNYAESPRRGITQKIFPHLSAARPSAFSALLEKDARELSRNPRELASGLFIVFLLIFYLSLLTRLPDLQTAAAASLIPFLLAMHMSGLGYFAATLALRFVFPLVGIERNHAWIAFSSPVSPAKIFIEKFIFGFLLLIILMELLIAVTVPSFAIPAFLGGVIALFGIAQAFAIAAIATGISTLDPGLRKRDPERMSTTLPGLATTAITLGYVLLGGAILFRISQAFIFQNIILADMLSAYMLFSMLLGIYFLFLGQRKLAQADFA